MPRMNHLATHAACAAAGVRDGLRTAQFYARDVSNADGVLAQEQRDAPFLSRLVGGLGRGIDRLLSRLADVSVQLVRPQWRDLPSPFAPGMRSDVMKAIQQNEFAFTSQFTAYFFRAARHILDRTTARPHLVMEHRVESARRMLEVNPVGAQEAAETALAKVLLHLVRAAPIARHGKAKSGYDFMQNANPNVAVMATACLALLLAEEGKPLDTLDEDEFFEISGALIASHLPAIAKAVAAQDVEALAGQLRAVKSLY